MYMPDISLNPAPPATGTPPKASGPSTDGTSDSRFQNLLQQKSQDASKDALSVVSPPVQEAPAEDELLPQEMLAALLLPVALPLDLQSMMKGAAPVVPQAVAAEAPALVQPEAPIVTTQQQTAQAAPAATVQTAPLTTSVQQMAAAQTTPVQQPTAQSQPVTTPQAAPLQEVAATQNAPRQDAQLLSQEQGDSNNSALFEQAEAPAKPLFQNTEQIPVKVGDAPTLDTQSADFNEQLGRQISKALQNGEQKLSISLSPDNLGKMVVELTRSPDGALQVLLHASTSAAATLLNDRSMELSAMLRNNTQAPVYIEVQHPQESSAYHQQQQNQHNQQNQQGQQQQQNQHGKQQVQDFLEQLRLGMILPDAEAV